MSATITSLTPDQQSEILNAVDNYPEKDVDLIINKRRYKPKDEFCFYFVTNMKKLVLDPDIKLQDLRIIAVYADKMAYGNQVSISQQDVADELDIDKARVSESVKKLLKKGVFYREKRSLYMNWQYLAKGNLQDFASAKKQVDEAIKNKNTTPTNTTSCKTTSCAIYALFFLSATVAMAAQIMTMAQTVGI